MVQLSTVILVAECSWARAHQTNLMGVGQAKRLRIAIGWLGITLALLVFVIKGDYPMWTRTLVFFPLLLSTGGAYSGLYKTCLVNSMKGVRDTDEDGEVPVVNSASKCAMVSEGWRVARMSLLTALIATSATLLIP